MFESPKPNFEELHTVLVQIENVMNIRSLIYLSRRNCGEYINQPHLMYCPNKNTRNIVDENENVITLEKILIKTRIKHVTVVTNQFLNRLEIEYLL